MLAAILAVILVCAVLLDFVLAKKNREYGSKIPGPKPLPFIGNAFLLLGDGVALLNTLTKLGKEFGSRYRIFLGHILFVVLNDAKDVEALVSSYTHIEKSDEYIFLHPWLSTGLITGGGSKWRKRRKMLTPAFHFKILENFLPIFNRTSDILVKKLSEHVGKGKFDVFYPITLCTLDAISESAMGVSVNAQEDDNSKYTVAIKEVLRICLSRMKNLWYRSDFLFYFTKEHKKMYDSIKTIHDYTYDIIRERRRMINNGEIDIVMDEDKLDIGVKKKLAFLDLLIMSTIDGEKLNDFAIREEVDTFMFAGHDTTTAGISFALHSIAANERVQKQLYEEQVEIFGNDFSRSATYADLQSMKYMEATIKESLRMHPPVPLIARKLTEDTTLNDMKLPADSSLIINLYSLHRDPEMFPDPEKFLPERFLQECITKRHPYSYVAFSAGPRNCIGQRFAMLEMKSIISKIIRNFVLISTDDQPQISMDIILSSANGVYLKMAKR